MYQYFPPQHNTAVVLCCNYVVCGIMGLRGWVSQCIIKDKDHPLWYCLTNVLMSWNSKGEILYLHPYCHSLTGASIVIILIHAALHIIPPQDSDDGEIEVTMEEVSVQWTSATHIKYFHVNSKTLAILIYCFQILDDIFKVKS